jgi:hypothetical protein
MTTAFAFLTCTFFLPSSLPASGVATFWLKKISFFFCLFESFDVLLLWFFESFSAEKKRGFFQLGEYAYSKNNPQKIQQHAATNEGSTSGRSLIC